MAQAPIPDKMRPALALLAKHHFWLLAVVIPVVLLPLLFMARGQLSSQITGVRNQIKGHLDALQGIRKISQHPNASWKADIDASTARVKKETLAEWQRFWDSQKPFRTWPESLGPNFVKAADELKPDGKLSRKLLEQYQNYVRSLVRELPERMGVEQLMAENDEGGPAGSGMPRSAPRPDALPPGGFPPGAFPPGGFPPGMQPGGDTQASRYFFTWNAGNQRRIYDSFYWEKTPTTTRVLLAQEELRLYGLFCDTIARINKPGTGPHNVPILSVDELLVGYPAAEDNPGGVLGGRITRPAPANGAGGMSPDMMGMGGMGGMMGGGMPPDMMQGGAAGGPGPGPRPANPRFAMKEGGGNMAVNMPPPGEGDAAAAVSPDDMLRNWIYVDFAGKPLDATQLAAAADAQMVHLVPFVMRLVIDQRQIDNLLVDLASGPLPIDVRQVRINPGAAGSGGNGPAPPSAGPGAAFGRMYDVTLELRGTVGLATPPNEKAVGLEPAESGGAPSGDSAAMPGVAAPPAAAGGRPGSRREAA